MSATPPQPSRYATGTRRAWALLAAGLSIPLGLSRLPLPHPTAPLAPQALANLAYGLGIALIAAALLVRHSRPAANGQAHPRETRNLLLSAALAHSVGWLGFAAWLADSRTPAFSVLLIMAAVTFWLIRPRTGPRPSTMQQSQTPHRPQREDHS